MSPEIEEFAQKLVEFVRDASIQSNDTDLRPHAANPVAKRWRQAAHGEQAHELAKVMIPDVIDDTIFYLLQAIDQGSLPLAFISTSGKAINLTAEGDGELSGWYMGSGGWRAMYSKERFADDCSDL